VKILVKDVVKLFHLHMSVKLLFAKLGWLRTVYFRATVLCIR